MSGGELINEILKALHNNVIITNPNPLVYINEINKDLKCLRDWFNTNLLSLNISKTYLTHFTTKNNSVINLNFTCDNKIIPNISNLKFLGLDFPQ